MARLLGRYQVPGCCPGTRAGWQPGPDCSGGGSMGRRAAKRAEERLAAAEMESVAAWYDSSEGRQWVERSLAEAEGWPYWDFSDCQHGCNGSPCGSERCTFICHPR